jgi:Fur family transcriptional regulator, peroxide stress response regulator
MKNVENLKRKHSVKRDRILELLRGCKEHPTADWVYERLKKEYPDLSLGTVYRNLRILAEEGRIFSIRNGSTFDRFDADLAPHQHLTCECCGRVMDIEIDLDGAVLRRLEAQTGYRVSSPRVSIGGICPECQKME